MRIQSPSCLACLIFLIGLHASTASAIIDDSATQGVWRLKFGVTSVQFNDVNWQNADTDGDGLKNADECAAGTNPFLAGEVVRVTLITVGGANVSLTFPSVTGKQYVVQGSVTLSGFASISPLLTDVGTGNPMTLTRPKGVNKFFRVLVQDIDSDGDGLSDWVELLTTGHPNSTTQTEKDADYALVTEQIALPDDVPNEVIIMATEPFASEDGPTAGKLTISRTRALFPITVQLAASGTAVSDVDYAALPLSVDLAAGVGSLEQTVNPIVDAPLPVVEGSKSVTATLVAPGGASPAFTLGSNDHATVIIGDSKAPVGTGLTARYYDHSNTVYAHAANFGDAGNYAYTRAGVSPNYTGSTILTPTTGSIAALQVGNVVRLSFLGGNLNTATYNNVDYTVTAKTATTFTVTMPPGASLPASSSSTCNYSIRSYTHPAVIERVDPVVSNDWAYGTPNDVTVVPNNPVENYSTVFEGYLHPTTAGNYRFQLDADDKARVLLDLDNNGTFELPGEQIIEHGWEGTAETIGTFKQTSDISLAVPAGAAQRYRMRVEHVETTGDARCRLQWLVPGTTSYANIPSANVFSHTRALTNYTVASQIATINTAVAHGLTAGVSTVTLYFTAGTLFTPPANYSGTYTVQTTPTSTSFTINVSGAANQSATTGLMVDTTSTTAGWLSQVYTNTTFSTPAGYVGVLSAGATNANNGIWGSGTPDPALIGKDTFSIRWTGQVQPQFSETYTFIVQADDGCSLWINGQPQVLSTVPSTNQGGSTYSYNSTTGDVVVTYSGLVVNPNSFIVGETVRVDPSSGNLIHGTGSTYTFNGVTGVATVDYSNLANITPGGFVNGEIIELDPTSDTLTSLATLPYAISNVTPTTFDINIGTGVFASGAGTINIADTRNALVTAATATSFTFHIGSGKYTTGGGNISVEIANKQLKEWSSMGNERYVRIPMVGGVRYDIQLDYYENASYSRCLLSWFSPSQPKQIIPSERLYPTTVPQAPAAHIASTDASALVNGPFSHAVAGSNGGNVTISGNPAWLTYSGGFLTGTPPSGAAGDYQIIITITNAIGTSTSVLNLHVEDAGGSVVREFWNGVSGTDVADIPVSTTPSGSGNLTSLEGPTDFGDNYGARVRGYITAPTTGNYYFWIAGNNAAELWISNDDEPINLFKRAAVTAGSATPQTWNVEPGQKSPWLALVQGRKYYFEILHKAGAGVGDNVAVGWAKPGDATTAPSQIVPGYVLSPYVAPAPGSTPGTLYVATMLSQSGAITNGVGTSTLRLSEDENSATMNYSYVGLTGPITSQHIHTDPYLAKPSTIVYDIDTPVTPGDGLQPDGSYKWTILPVGTLTKADIIEIIKQGKAYINLHTAAYPNGEIRGNYTLANGSRTFTPPPAPPSFADDHTTNDGASRFLTQATFGPNIADITALKGMASYEAWIDDQFNKPASLHLPEVLRTENASAQGGAFDEALTFNVWWWRSIAGDDQLRQRIAFALSEIHVVSAQGPLDNNALALSYFYDKLAANAFGNFRDILQDTTLTPSMGRYLDMLRNDKPDQTIGRIPNENYAREIKQLFSVGLYRIWPDGTLMLTSKDHPIDTYTQREIVGLSHVFTGWDYGYDGAMHTSFSSAANWTRQMRETPARHFTGTKRILNNEVLPGLQSLGGQPLDPYAAHTSNNYNDPAYQALPAQELGASHDQLFNHPNVGPFICRQLIQRLVTSHPSRDYLYRVVQKFNDNGSGVRGDMKAVIKAILLDYEARSTSPISIPAYGKQREPVMRVAAAARAFRTDPFTGTYSQSATPISSARNITVTTPTPHKLASGNNVFLDFTTGSPAPWIGSYSVSNVTSNSFTVTARDWMTGTYSQTGGSNVMTITISSHWLEAGNKAFFVFTSGPAVGLSGLDNQVNTVATSTSTDTVAGTTFTITAPDATARSGNVMIPRFTPGSFTTSASGLAAPNDRRVTMDTNVNHELNVGDKVWLNFTFGSNPHPVDMEATVESIVDLNTWTFLAPAAGTNLSPNQGNNSVYQFPLKSLPLTRSGNVGSRPSTFAVGNTTTDLEQSPLNSPTVFNFFVPDYKYPGTLASQGITTPEFAITAETTVIRQANYLYNGMFNPSGNTSGLSSFNTGNNALIMDTSAWMGALASDLGLGTPANLTVPWTHNQNISTLIDQMSTLLMAGQLSSGTKTIIYNFVARPISSIAATSPCTVTTTTNHGYNTGDSVVISGVTGGTYSTGSFGSNSTARTITVTGLNTFTVNGVNCSVAPTSVTNAHVSPVTYNMGTTNPSATERRDRLRTILHLILTSPEFTIQR